MHPLVVGCFMRRHDETDKWSGNNPPTATWAAHDRLGDLLLGRPRWAGTPVFVLEPGRRGAGSAPSRPCLRHGVLQREVAYDPNPVHTQYIQRATAATKIMVKDWLKKILVPFNKKQLSTMPRTGQLNPCIAHPHSHPGC